MNIIVIHLPESYRHDHFKLIIEDKSNDTEIVNQTKLLSESGDQLKNAVEENSPK